MRNFTILAMCTVCLCIAVSSLAAENRYIRVKSDLAAQNTSSPSNMNDSGLRSWLKTVKPAAGDHQPRVTKTLPVNYWHQKVTRRRPSVQ